MRLVLMSQIAALTVLALPQMAIAVTPSGALSGVTFRTGVERTVARAPRPVWDVTFEAEKGQTARTAPAAVEYDDAYRLRAKIHKYASVATLPLFVAEGFVGQSLYNDPTESKKSAHLAIASGIGALFAINATTGVWNMIASRKDPHDRSRRTLHGILMLAASAGFLAAAATGPDSEREHGQAGTLDLAQANTHRAIVFTSFGIAATSYLIMVFHR